MQSTLAVLQKQGLVPSAIASDAALRKCRRIQPSGDGVRSDADLIRNLQLSLTLLV
jgi:hypothetical protein